MHFYIFDVLTSYDVHCNVHDFLIYFVHCMYPSKNQGKKYVHIVPTLDMRAAIPWPYHACTYTLQIVGFQLARTAAPELARQVATLATYCYMRLLCKLKDF